MLATKHKRTVNLENHYCKFLKLLPLELLINNKENKNKVPLHERALVNTHLIKGSNLASPIR